MCKYKVLALMGESGSGKDTLASALCNGYPNFFRRVVTCTTRPPRDNEKDGIDYYFLTPDEFACKVLDGSMLEAQVFNNWHYGTPIESFYKDIINVIILTPEGVRIIKECNDIDLLTVYVTAPAKERIIRSLKREKNPDIDEIYRRYKADEKDFSDLSGIDYYILNHTIMFFDAFRLIRDVVRGKNWEIV